MRVSKFFKPILEWAEHVYFIGGIAGSWSVSMSALLALGAGFWTWSAEHSYVPIFLVMLFTFAVTIWAFIGIIWLRRQVRPSKAKLTFEYSYGIALDEIVPSHDKDNQINSLEFRFHIRNVAPGPLKYKAERVDVIIGDRIRTERNLIGVLPRTSWTQLMVGGFDQEVVGSLEDRTAGVYEMSIIYGHPDDEYSRRAKKRIRFELIKRDNIISNAPWRILEESDEPTSLRE